MLEGKASRLGEKGGGGGAGGVYADCRCGETDAEYVNW